MSSLLATVIWKYSVLKFRFYLLQDLTQDEIYAKQREIFAHIPEFYVKDMCSWFSFVAVHKPGALKGLNVSAFSSVFPQKWKCRGSTIHLLNN